MQTYVIDQYHGPRFVRRSAVEATGPITALFEAYDDLPRPMRLHKVSFKDGRLTAWLPRSQTNFIVASI